MTRKQWARLTDNEKRIKIAKLCGWEDICISSDGIMDGVPPDNKIDFNSVPDYLNDLNAMYNVVHEMKSFQLIKYAELLVEMQAGSYVGAIEATASQRAEAFALTMEPENDVDLTVL